MPAAQLQASHVNQQAMASGQVPSCGPGGKVEGATTKRNPSAEAPKLAEQLQAALSGFSRDFNCTVGNDVGSNGAATGNGNGAVSGHGTGSGPPSAPNTRPVTPSQAQPQAQPQVAGSASVRAALPKEQADALEKQLGLDPVCRTLR